MWSWHLQLPGISLHPPAGGRPASRLQTRAGSQSFPRCLLASRMASRETFGLRTLQGRNGLTFGQVPFSLITTFMVCDSCRSSHTVPRSPHKVLALALLIGFLGNIQDMYISFLKICSNLAPCPSPESS
uniref:Uncharacterized protein n=1 Tax=Molossus molossus TaxID=27622 RepID=A0A7J8I7V4_MOLMO|nr:hypothetical protein HJG59_010507 [Molossus molossus]